MKKYVRTLFRDCFFKLIFFYETNYYHLYERYYNRLFWETSLNGINRDNKQVLYYNYKKHVDDFLYQKIY